jgi:hypothetical protein
LCGCFPDTMELLDGAQPNAILVGPWICGKTCEPTKPLKTMMNRWTMAVVVSVIWMHCSDPYEVT